LQFLTTIEIFGAEFFVSSPPLVQISLLFTLSMFPIFPVLKAPPSLNHQILKSWMK
jgi:hypothetical protein